MAEAVSKDKPSVLQVPSSDGWRPTLGRAAVHGALGDFLDSKIDFIQEVSKWKEMSNFRRLHLLS